MKTDALQLSETQFLSHSNVSANNKYTTRSPTYGYKRPTYFLSQISTIYLEGFRFMYI